MLGSGVNLETADMAAEAAAAEMLAIAGSLRKQMCL